MSGELEKVNGTPVACWTAHPDTLRRYHADIVEPEPDSTIRALAIGILVLLGFALVTLVTVLGGALAGGIAIGATAATVGWAIHGITHDRR